MTNIKKTNVNLRVLLIILVSFKYNIIYFEQILKFLESILVKE